MRQLEQMRDLLEAQRRTSAAQKEEWILSSLLKDARIASLSHELDSAKCEIVALRAEMHRRQKQLKSGETSHNNNNNNNNNKARRPAAVCTNSGGSKRKMRDSSENIDNSAATILLATKQPEKKKSKLKLKVKKKVKVKTGVRVSRDHRDN